MNNELNNVLNRLERWSSGGIEELSNGTKLICRTPNIAPEAWLHIIYSKLTVEQVVEFEKNFPVKFPDIYIEFLKEFNGINIFSDSLSIWGLRTSFIRTGEEAIQPYDILRLNEERPKGCSNDWLFFGSYSWDGTRLVFDLCEGTNTKKVYRCARKSTEILQEWSSFSEWLIGEIERLGHLFDSNGIKYDKKAPTSPSV